ncbi:hypothetical protein ADK60_38625 [Streptomyces sp. XY431]|uniref:hypothetical protein n=1 Tax=Streptomyces sp. XY431 TaxID=1415562 RepID=UPI0006AEC77F|nr:hypothetical protein [Streptomyces sp. XY431]KOV10166.1 hypothetical protein ADK60_38625 [Streptomyces sp. XY431]
MPRFAVYIDNTETFRFVVEAADYEAAEAEALAAFESDARTDAYSHGHEPTVYDPELLDALPAAA